MLPRRRNCDSVRCGVFIAFLVSRFQPIKKGLLIRNGPIAVKIFFFREKRKIRRLAFSPDLDNIYAADYFNRLMSLDVRSRQLACELAAIE